MCQVQLFVCQPDDLDETQQKELALIRQASPSAETAYGLAQAFMRMIREQTGQQLGIWIRSVEESHLPDLESFAKGIQQDQAAVFAGLTLPYSTGPVEGHVNRLKLLKRSMYGRAKLLCCEHVCCMWPRRSLRAQPSSLDSDVPHVARRGGTRRLGRYLGTEQADVGRRNHSRRTEARRTMRMAFDINEAVFDEQGTYLEEKAVRFEQALMDQFAASPEGQAITQRGTELGWARAMLHYAITYPGVIPPTMTPSDLEEVVYDLFPRKVIAERGDGAEIIQELWAFWHFLQRVYQLPQAKQMLARLTPQAARRLERKMQEPANFGMAKSFIMMGKEAGFDMESPEGMQAWVEVYNAIVAPTMTAPEPPTKKKSRGASKGTMSAQRRKRKRTTSP